MKLRIHALMLGAIVVGVLIQTSGCCTLIGFGIGSMVDAREPLPPVQWASISQGTKMEVTLREGPRFQTHFLVMYGDQMEVDPGPPWLPNARIQGEAGGPMWIPREEIAAIEVHKRQATTGLAVGLAVDVILMVTMAAGDYWFHDWPSARSVSGQ